MTVSWEGLHTTPMGEVRIRKNLSLPPDTDVVAFCRALMEREDAVIYRQGKNWYIEATGITITVNAYSLTIITAHNSK